MAATSLIISILNGCSGGGGSSSTPQPTPIVTASPSPVPTGTPTPGPPGPIIATWKGDGAYVAHSNPNWPLSFLPYPGAPGASLTVGPPIVFTAIGQTVSIIATQANNPNFVPMQIGLIGQCSGIGHGPNGVLPVKISYAGPGSSNCSVQIDGNIPGLYVGVAVTMGVQVPAGG